MEKKLKIAVIGAGISGLGASWLLSKHHDVTIFEAADYLGGHANTVSIPTLGHNVDVDTGFIVCNDRNYPNFLSLMKEIGVSLHPTEMSFSVSVENGAYEYAGSDRLSSLIAQPSNLFKPRFWNMIQSLMRFYKTTNTLNSDIISDITLKEYVAQEGYSNAFMKDHLLPMAAAIWSTPSSSVGDFPLSSFLRFCQNHGLLQVNNRPQWYTVPGGSKTYVQALVEQTAATFVRNTPIKAIHRLPSGIAVIKADGEADLFDRVLLATHANTALEMLADADGLEQDILSRFSYSRNKAVLHSDTRFMPKRKKAWASWNYVEQGEADNNHLSVTYWMNKLQPLNTDEPVFVTLNPTDVPATGSVHYETDYEHPIFNLETLTAQRRLMDIMGHRGIWYAGAHFGYGFHEDGLQSGLFAAEHMAGIHRPWYHEDMNNRIIALNSNCPKPVSPPVTRIKEVV